MHRRQFLSRTAAATSVAALAGCTQGIGGAPINESAPSTNPGTGERTSPDPAAGQSVPFSQSFDAGQAQCRTSEETVDISLDDEAGEVTLDGRIGGSNLCYTAELASAEYDESADRLTVAVRSVDDCEEGMLGGQCIAAIPYEATFGFGDSLPATVSVTHDGEGIASAAWDSQSATPPE